MNKEAEIPQDISGDQIGNTAIGWDIKDYRVTEMELQVLKESNCLVMSFQREQTKHFGHGRVDGTSNDGISQTFQFTPEQKGPSC